MWTGSLVPPVSKDGDVWLLGKHRLVCGDSTKEETYVTLMDGKKANLVSNGSALQRQL